MNTWSHKLLYYRDKNRKWRFKLQSRNRKLNMSSEAYANITMCRRSATRLVDSIKNKTLIAEVKK